MILITDELIKDCRKTTNTLHKIQSLYTNKLITYQERENKEVDCLVKLINTYTVPPCTGS